jgi:hypothetical protein
VALVQPAVRTIVVVAGLCEGGEPFSEVYPVLAVQTTVDPDAGACAVEQCLLVVDNEGTLREYTDFPEWLPDNDASRIVACTWPPQEDEERLSPVVKELMREARHKVERDRLRQAEREAGALAS